MMKVKRHLETVQQILQSSVFAETRRECYGIEAAGLPTETDDEAEASLERTRYPTAAIARPLECELSPGKIMSSACSAC